MSGNSNSVRLIAGQWRGRRIGFPDAQGLRPTGDRIRETLFNWLQPRIGDAHCLDAFAGSGALGFEAASRGAASVTLLEQDRNAIQALQHNANQLNADMICILEGDALRWKPASGERFDIVFIDPPFSAGLQQYYIDHLIHLNCLAEHAVIYLECDQRQGFPDLPAGWSMMREKTAGEVCYGLAQRT